MLKIEGQAFQKCSGGTRRNFLQIGAPLLGLGLADLLRLECQAAEAGRLASRKSLIVFWTDGGVSQQDTWDLKPNAPSEYRGMYQPIGTKIPGIQLSEGLPCQAQVMDRLSIVRSVHHENGIHAPSAHWMQTGYFGPTLARNAAQKPSFGSVISRSLGSRLPPLPAYVTIPKSEAFGYQGGVYLGKAFNPFEVGADPNAADFKLPSLSLPTGLTTRTIDLRRALLKTFDTLRRDIDDNGVMEGLDTFKSQALEMVSGDQVRTAFDLNAEDATLRDKYGRHRYGQSALLARRLVESGVRCVNINTGNWDHHNDIAKGLEEHLPPLDKAIAALVDDLTIRGMLNDVIIYCVGEFGRTPRMNGHAGRDHWADCFSVLLAGGGIPGGRVIGASEKWGGGVQERPVTPLDLLATIYHTLGISLDTHFEDASGRPVSIVGGGRPIAELT
ncbi:MAG: DUF1501 domain-containing protein [Planctomycetales bacterium]|nr:DUF1501 domain-containing protein [Planctomycetales bacterium]